MAKQKCLIYGAGGHAKVAYSILCSGDQYEVAGFVDAHSKLKVHCSLPVWRELPGDIKKGIVAIGDNWSREKVVGEILTLDPSFEFINAVHSTAIIEPGVKFGVGNLVAANAVINIDSRIANHCIINTGAQVDHDGILDDYCSLGPGAILGGNVQIHKRAIVSLGASIIHGKIIGADSLIGAGASVVSNVESNWVAMGIPAKNVRKRDSSEKYL